VPEFPSIPFRIPTFPPLEMVVAFAATAMNLLFPVLFAAVVLGLAYVIYGRLLARLFRLDRDRVTPAVEMRDGVDYEPIEPKFLMSQHFSAIAAAGPIVGPILAGLMFGWVPAFLWILIGSVFIGGVHDMGSLVASIRHRAQSMAEVVRQHMTRRSQLLFLAFVWIALVYIIVAFADIVAGSFVGRQVLESGVAVTGAGIATSSLLYLVLPVVMGLLLRFTKLSLGWATAIFLPLVGVSIWAGQHLPFDLGALLGIGDPQAQRVWGWMLLGYCFVASIVPLWALLQPRGHLGGYFLYVAIGGGVIGILFGGHSIQYPAFTGWAWQPGAGGMAMPLFPMLFITIACGACSGFHSIIASGTTCKQLRRETDAKSIGYGTMLLEGMVAVLSLACVMMLTAQAGGALIGKPNYVYAQGLGQFLGVVGVPLAFAVSFGLLAFTTFVYDTLDVCTRLGRYILQELFGWKGTAGRLLATLLTVGVPALFLSGTATDAAGKVIPAWRMFWPVFGASNQLLAALALMGVTVWLYRTYRARWVWWVTGLPTVFMYVMSMWALSGFVRAGFFNAGGAFKGFAAGPVPWVAAVLIGLALLLLGEAVVVVAGVRRSPPPKEGGAVPVGS